MRRLIVASQSSAMAETQGTKDQKTEFNPVKAHVETLVAVFWLFGSVSNDERRAGAGERGREPVNAARARPALPGPGAAWARRCRAAALPGPTLWGLDRTCQPRAFTNCLSGAAVSIRGGSAIPRLATRPRLRTHQQHLVSLPLPPLEVSAASRVVCK